MQTHQQIIVTSGERKRGQVRDQIVRGERRVRGRPPGRLKKDHRHGDLGALSFAAVPMRHCIYPGTFDPITYGHLDVLSRAARLFDHVTVAVAVTAGAGKAPVFSAEQRVEMIRPNVTKLPNVSITMFHGLLVEFCMAQKADAIIRGLRALSDFEFEFNMALMNRHLEPKLEALFVMPSEEFSYTSSSLVKQVARFGGDVQKFVPPNVAKALKQAYAPPAKVAAKPKV
jgi:pantetheine-phosphate adenylyltransferase